MSADLHNGLEVTALHNHFFFDQPKVYFMHIDGVGDGDDLAHAIIGDASNFKNGRSFAAFIVLVPKQSSSAGKERLGKISKRGDHYLRWLLVVGGLAVIRYAQRHGTRRPWLLKLLQRRTTKIAAVARANKIARIAWVLMTRGQNPSVP